MTMLWQDIGYGCRMLAKYPGMTVTIVVALALGIGANTATFSAAEWLCLRPMPFAEPHRVARLAASSERDPRGWFHYADYQPIKEQMSSFSGLAAVEYRGTTLKGDPWTQNLLVAVVSRNFFSVLGVKAYRGRVFTEDDDPDLKTQHAVVLSHRLWRSRFGGDPGLVGTTRRMSGYNYLILGIAPPGFEGVEREIAVDMWYPMETPGSTWEGRRPTSRSFTLLGRLTPHVSVGQAQKEAEVVFARLGLRDRGTQAELKPTVLLDRDYHRRTSGSSESLRQMAITLVVLVIACANVCGLLLAHAQTRGKEMALRRTLGSTRVRLIRQLFTEGCLLSLLAQGLGLLIAVWLIGLLRVSLPQAAADPQFGMRLNVPVVGFSVGLSLLATLAFGLLPAWYASKMDLVSILKADSVHTRQPGHALRGLNALVVGQLAMALILVAVTGLLLRSYLNRSGEDLGFEKKNILITEVGPAGDTPECQAFYRTLLPRIKAMPGVKNATVTLSTPFIGDNSGWGHQVSLPGEGAANRITYNLVDPEYFGVLGIPLLRGRGFEEQDGHSGGKVVVINETLARRFWPEEDPVGKFIRIEREEARVIGVVRDGRYQSITDPAEAYLYIPLTQQFYSALFLLVETEGNPRALVRPVCEVIRGVDRGMDLYPMKTLADCIESVLLQPRRAAQFAGALGLVGVILAGAGLYGVVSFAMGRRIQEFGIRMALGAHRRDILGLVMRRGIGLGLSGIGFGLIGTLMAGRVVKASLYEVDSLDPMTLVLSAVALFGLTLLACYLPARRAARIDPMAALRHE
jgi:predicted permease